MFTIHHQEERGNGEFKFELFRLQGVIKAGDITTVEGW